MLIAAYEHVFDLDNEPSRSNLMDILLTHDLFILSSAYGVLVVAFPVQVARKDAETEEVMQTSCDK